MRLCAHCGKIAHASGTAATAHLNKLRERNRRAGAATPQRVYFCGPGNCFHVGKETKHVANVNAQAARRWAAIRQETGRAY